MVSTAFLKKLAIRRKTKWYSEEADGLVLKDGRDLFISIG